MANMPEWWSWELHFSDHLLLRMRQRGFNEAELRGMLDDATGIAPDIDPGRWFITTHFRGVPWAVVVQPDPSENIIVVITAFEIY